MCTTFNDLWIFDLNEKTWNRPLVSGNYPPPKACASMVSFRNKLYLFGGWTHCSAYPLNQDWKLFDDLHEFDLIENKWTLIKSTNNQTSSSLPSSSNVSSIHPPPMAGHCASVINNKMLIYGGLLYSQGTNFNPICVNKDIWIYDFELNRWFKKEIQASDECPNARYGHTQIVLDDNSLAIIGGCSSPKILYNDIWILKLDFANLNACYFKRVAIESNETFNSPIFGFHQAVKVDDMIIFLSNICTNSKSPLERKNRRLFRNDGNADQHYPHQASFALNNNDNSNNAFNNNQMQFNQQLNHQINRLQAQPTQNERRALFLASFNKLEQQQQHDNLRKSADTDPKAKCLKSSTIKLATIKNEHRLKPANPMALHVLDFSKVLTNHKATWLNQVRRFDGPDEIMLYSLVAATNELILFGGIEKVPFNHNLSDRKIEIVSNSVYIASPKNIVI